jgi:uncharacterized protein YukE
MAVELYMNVEACTNVVANIRATRDSLSQQLINLKAAADAMVNNTWVAPGAALFQNEFQSWQASLSTQIEELNNYASKLEQEIQDWVTAGNS